MLQAARAFSDAADARFGRARADDGPHRPPCSGAGSHSCRNAARRTARAQFELRTTAATSPCKQLGAHYNVSENRGQSAFP